MTDQPDSFDLTTESAADAATDQADARLDTYMVAAFAVLDDEPMPDIDVDEFLGQMAEGTNEQADEGPNFRDNCYRAPYEVLANRFDQDSMRTSPGAVMTATRLAGPIYTTRDHAPSKCFNVSMTIPPRIALVLLPLTLVSIAAGVAWLITVSLGPTLGAALSATLTAALCAGASIAGVLVSNRTLRVPIGRPTHEHRGTIRSSAPTRVAADPSNCHADSGLDPFRPRVSTRSASAVKVQPEGLEYPARQLITTESDDISEYALIFEELIEERSASIGCELSLRAEPLLDIGALWSGSYKPTTALATELADEVSDYLRRPVAEAEAETAWLDLVVTEHRRALQFEASRIVTELPRPTFVPARPLTITPPSPCSRISNDSLSNVADLVLHSLDNYVRNLFTETTTQCQDSLGPRCAIVTSSRRDLRFTVHDPNGQTSLPLTTRLLVWIDKEEWTVVRQAGLGKATILTSRSNASRDRSSLVKVVQVATELAVGESCITEIPYGPALHDEPDGHPALLHGSVGQLT